MTSPNGSGSKVTLDLSEFTLEVCSFEVRYPRAYLIWDRQGTIWSQVAETWPDLLEVHVEPSKGVFRLQNKYDVTIQFDRASVAAYMQRTNSEDHSKFVESFINLVTEGLELVNYSRLGFRAIYFKEYASQNDATRAFLSIGGLRVPHGPVFGINDPPTLADYDIRWENESNGATVRLRVEVRKTEFEPGPNLKGVTAHKAEEYGIVYDVDYYTTAMVSVDQLRARDWMNQAMHLIKRDSKEFLRGTT